MTKTSRRTFFTLSALGAAATLAPERILQAAAPSAAEQANIKVVTDFCAAWAGHDLNKLMSFFADNCAYRVSEARDPIKGRDAVTATIKGFLDRVLRFEVLDTYAKGPMVFNERIDHFTPGGQMPLKSWHGVGVFFLKDGKIVEWQDYTISTERS
jgi:limonene-1,2-epoxide hydrolase